MASYPSPSSNTSPSSSSSSSSSSSTPTTTTGHHHHHHNPHSSPGSTSSEDHKQHPPHLHHHHPQHQPDDRQTAECQIFDRGFLSFFQSGDFSDVTLVAKETGVEYNLHKIILAYSSKYFANYFDTMEKTRNLKLVPTKTSTNSNTNTTAPPSLPSTTNRPVLSSSNGVRTSPQSNDTVNTSTSALLSLPKTRTNTTSIPPTGTSPPANNTNTTTTTSPPKKSSSNSNNSNGTSNNNATGTSPPNTTSPRPTASPPLRRSHSKITTHSDDEEEDGEGEDGVVSIASNSTLADLLTEIDSGEKDKIELGGPFTQYFQHVVKYPVTMYMYEGSVEFTSENAIPLLAMADFYQIKELRHAASDYLLSSITRENALMMLQKAIHFKADEVANKCITVICKNFNQIASQTSSSSTMSPTLTTTTTSSNPSLQLTHHIPTSSTISLNSLPLSTVIRILTQNNLAAASEFVVYKTVCGYIEANSATLTSQDVNALFESVRFRWLTYEQLLALKENPQVPRHLLTEALFARLKPYEVPEQKEAAKAMTPFQEMPQDLRLQPRVAYTISLEYHSDFDEHGLFYYIGTNGGKEEWSNPGMRGRVRVTCSSQEKGNIVDLVGRTSTECWSMDVPSSWVMINLGSSRSLVPNYYTLRHGGNSRADGLRNWTLQGSNDAKTWNVLIRHSNDNSLNNNYASCSWPIPNCTQAYRYFRVLQNGRNSSNHNFLSLSGIEFYGDLYETRKDEPGSFF